MFDPYRKWLGILTKDQPPNHYRLLGVELFENDLDVIDGAADKQMAFVRQYQSGENAPDAAKILNELAVARLCLLKPAAKDAYDAKLRVDLSAPDSESTDQPAKSDDPVAKPVAAKVAKTDVIEDQKQKINELLARQQYSAAIELLERITNKQGAGLENLVTWAKARLPEVRVTVQKMQEASAPLYETGKKLFKRHDYSECVEILSALPPQYRSQELRELLRQSTELNDECNLLQRSIADAIQEGDEGSLPALVKQLLKLKPGSRSVKQLAEDLKRHGARQVIAHRRGQKKFSLSQERTFDPKQIIAAVALILGAFLGTSILVRSYLAKTARPEGQVDSLKSFPSPKPEDIKQDVAETSTVKAAVEESKSPVPEASLVRSDSKESAVDSTNAPLRSSISLSAQLGEWVDLLEWSEGVTWAQSSINWDGNIEGRPTRRGITLKQIANARFPLAAVMDGDYEMQVEFTRTKGQEGVAIYFPVGIHTMRLLLGSDSGAVSHVAFVDGKEFGHQRPAPITNNEPHRTLIRVRHAGDKAGFNIDWDNVTDYIQWEGAYTALKNQDTSDSRTNMIRRPWIGSSNNDVVFQRFSVRMTSGTIRRDPMTDADREQDLKNGFLRLTGEKASGVSVGAWSFGVNQIPLELGGNGAENRWPMVTPGFKFCDDYCGAHAPSRLKCAIPATARSFSAIGYNDSSRTAKFLVVVDGKQIYDSGETGLAMIKVDIPAKSKTIEFVADPVGENDYDRTYWCWPRFHSIAADGITEKMLEDKRPSLKFNKSSTAEAGITYDKPIGTVKSSPLHFRDFQPCDEFFFAHANSTMTFQVPEGMSRFTAVGVNVISHSAKYEVWADGVRLYESPEAGIISIDVKLPSGTKTIELKTTEVGGGAGDQTIWCYPRLYQK